MKIFDQPTVTQWIESLHQQLQPYTQDIPPQKLVLAGIQSGGVHIGRILHQKLAIERPMSELNISFYRDDFARVGLHPKVGPSRIQGSLEGCCVILVDDVLYTGRTVRAALNELFDYGRPAQVLLAILVERSGHKLPIRADVKAHTMVLDEHTHIKLDAQNMRLEMHQL